MYFRANNSISLTVVNQEVSVGKTAVGLALTHSGDQGTKQKGLEIANQRLQTALSNGDRLGVWGAGSFTCLTDYMQDCLKSLKYVESNFYSSVNRRHHKGLFNNPIAYLQRTLGHPPIESIKVVTPVCDACGSDQVYERHSLVFWGPTEHVVEDKYGIKLPETVSLCKTCFRSKGWTDVATDIAKRIKAKRKEVVEKLAVVDPNTKMVGYTVNKIGNKYSVCVMFETDKDPIQNVDMDYFLSPQIIMATSKPLP